MKHIFFYFSLFRSCSFQSFFPCVLYFTCLLLSVFLPCLSLHILYFLFVLYLPLSVFYYISPLTFFVNHLILLSASISFFVFYFPSWLSSTFILCQSCIIFPLLFCLSFCAFAFFYYYYYFYSAVIFFRIFYLSVFCLPFLLISIFYSFSFVFLNLFLFPLSLIISY